MPQLFYLDVCSFLEDYEGRLRAHDGTTLTTLEATFTEWWQSTAFQGHLEKPEEDIVMGVRRVPALHVAEYWTVASGASSVKARLEREQDRWVVPVADRRARKIRVGLQGSGREIGPAPKPPDLWTQEHAPTRSLENPQNGFSTAPRTDT